MPYTRGTPPPLVMMDPSPPLPVTLCGSTANGPILRAIAQALEARGHFVELVVGVEVDAARLTAALTAHRGQGLFVFGRSRTLDRDAIESLQTSLLDHQIPLERMLTLAVDSSDVSDLESRIVSVIRRIAAKPGTTPSGRASGHGLAFEGDQAGERDDSFGVGGRIRRLMSRPMSWGVVAVGGVGIIALIVGRVGLRSSASSEASAHASSVDSIDKPDEPSPPVVATHSASSTGSRTPPSPAAVIDPSIDLPKSVARAHEAEDDPVVVEALNDRKIRAFDTYLVAPERKGALTYAAGLAYCASLEIAGLQQWRVPSIGELNSVASAKIIGKAIYWSTTPGDAAGDKRLVRNNAKDRISVVAQDWDGAKVVCVRPRRS